MHVDVYNRKQIEQLDPDPSKCLISISTPTVGSPLFDPIYKQSLQTTGWYDIIQLQFHDATYPHGDHIELFNEELAQATVQFIERNKDKDFVTHCDAGQSRSVAVGKFISETYQHTITLHAARNNDPKGNQLVTEQLHKAYEQLT